MTKNIEALTREYLTYCKNQKRLNEKTLRAYNIDLRQFVLSLPVSDIASVDTKMLEAALAKLHHIYQPKTAKRKIASLKAFFHYLEYREYILQNPFHKMQIHFREPVILPKTIPLYIIEQLLSTVYQQRGAASTPHRRKNALRDAAVIELLFATGIRISELCSLRAADVNLHDGVILIYGKGSKERRLYIGSRAVLRILQEYENCFRHQIDRCGHFFANQTGTRLTDQAIRRMLHKYASLAAIDLHITPHMFRHTFATSLLDADVDIRYIQEMLGHSSIHITEIYTHVAVGKQRNILSARHPRNGFHFDQPSTV